VQTNFGKPTHLDFGDSLQKDAPYQQPTAKIVDSSITGDDVIVTIEFFNPTATDETISATVLCSYTYLDSQMHTVSNSATGHIQQWVKSGGNTTNMLDIYVSAPGSNVQITSKPIIISVKTS
jgi:hypothetical protein